MKQAPKNDGKPVLARTPPAYRSWSADEKSDWLWNTLIVPSAHALADLPPLRLPFKTDPVKEIGLVLRKRELGKALTNDDDLMEPGRPKFIHAHGTVALVELGASPESPFTGMLGPPPLGGGRGLLRMSLVARVLANTAYTPALGLKLLVDGQPSADLLAMNHTVGQGRDFDLFSNSMTNDLSDEHDELRTPQKLLSVLFRRVSSNPRRLVVDHFADRHRNGSTVKRPVVPRRLVFHPTPQARNAFVGQAGVDFRRVLSELEPGTALYEIEGLQGEGSSTVGVLRTTTRFVSSDGGDRLFFRHVQDPRDERV